MQASVLSRVGGRAERERERENMKQVASTRTGIHLVTLRL